MPNPALALHIARFVALMGLLAFLVTALGSSIMNEWRQQQRGNEPAAETVGYDPGIRVLLTNPAADSDTHPHALITIHQAALLIDPQAEDTTEILKLNPQDELSIQPHPAGGLNVSIQSSEQRLRFETQELLLRPALTGKNEEIDASTGADWDAADDKSVFALAGKNIHYRGSLRIFRRGPASCYLINELSIESYLYGVVPAEMSASWPQQALRAQAVLSRSYAIAKRLSRRDKIFDVRDSTADQVYHGNKSSGQQVHWAITETRGQILTIDGVTFTPFFCASSGGQTAAVQEVFPKRRATDGKTRLDRAMPSVEDPYCKPGSSALRKLESRWSSTCVIKRSDLRKKLRGWLEKNKVQKSVGYISGIDVLKRFDDQRVAIVRIRSTRDSVEMTGYQFRKLVGATTLRSTRWGADSPKPMADEHSDLIECYGFGHGVGLSQVSAYAMAKFNRFGYRQIIQFFYPGAVLTTHW